MRKNLLFVCLLISIGASAFAQVEGSSFSATGRGGTATSFVTDYQAIGINPANLGFDTDFHIALGIGEFGYGFYSGALAKDDVRNILFNNEDTIGVAEQEFLAREFLNEGFTINIDIMPVGVSFEIPKFGTIGLSIKANVAYRTQFGGEAANIIFEGYNYEEYFDTIIFDGETIYGVAYEPLSLSELFEDTELMLNVNSEFNLAYGRKILGDDEKFALYGGAGVKFILGFAYLDISSEGGNLNGVSALGLDILDVGDLNTPFPITSSAAEPVGKGVGFDLGLSAKVAKTLTLGLAITDIGKMTYDANVLQVNDFVLDTVAFSGVNTTDPIELISQIFEEENLIEYSGLSEFEVSLPTKVRLGGSLQVSDIFNVGVDAIFPVNTVAGSLASPVLGLGGEVKMFKVIKLSAGLSTGGGYNYNIPAGIGLDLKFWELGVATRDVMTWFGEASPTVSFAAGFLRFKI
ncbi:MAG: hypothetical protein IPH42_07860 [Bacteroidetes bacterium]|nr:hypothetical protein [Bacteroidota bacterium]